MKGKKCKEWRRREGKRMDGRDTIGSQEERERNERGGSTGDGRIRAEERGVPSFRILQFNHWYAGC